MEIAFWILVGLVAYTYAGYPLLLLLLTRVRRRRISCSADTPSLSVIVAAYNEEKDIAAKLDLLLGMDYPREQVEIIVASDCSSDGTHAVVEGYRDRGVALVVLPQRGGKTAAQNLAAKSATGEILVFTDATTVIDRDALRRLVEPFADRRVGCTGAQLEYQSAGGSTVGRGGGLYWRYEKAIKALESRVNSLIGVSGCLYAVRRELYRPIAADLISDMVIALDIWLRGHLTVYAPGAMAYEVTHEVADKEFSMRARVVVRSINALLRRSALLNPFRHGLYAWQLWSHKVLRYLVPHFALGILVLNLWLVRAGAQPGWLYGLALAGQVVVYGVVPIVYLVSRRFGVELRILSAPFYFLLANAAAFWGFLRYLCGDRAVTWTTVR